MGYSYQDLDTRVAVLEEKMDFLLDMVYLTVNMPEGPRLMSAKELQRLQKSTGAQLTPQIEQKNG